MGEASKRNLSSLQVIKTLQLMLEDNYTVPELRDKLNSQPDAGVVKGAVIRKYINTFRACGFKIKREKGKYSITNMPFGIDLSGGDIRLLNYLYQTVQATRSTQTEKTFQDFFQRIKKYSNNDITRVSSKVKSLHTDIFERAMNQHKKIKLIIEHNPPLECTPIGLINSRDNLYYRIRDNNNKEKIIISTGITGMYSLNEDSSQINNENSVTFLVRGNLVKRYSLRPNEQLINCSNSFLCIMNTGENKELLFERLLRYDSCCEILSPESYRDEMRELIRQTLLNYGE